MRVGPAAPSRAGRAALVLILMAIGATAAVAGVSSPVDPPGVAAETTRRQLLQQAEQALRQGQPAVALHHLERAALMAHSPDTEMAMVHAYLQAGQYSQAASFSAHTAGAHKQVADGALLYARLLAVGGQHAAADQLLDAAIQRFPDDTRLTRLRHQSDRFTPISTLIGTPQRPDATSGTNSARLAPYPTGTSPAATARVAGSGVLTDGGRHALVPLALLDGARQIWLRDGLGQTRAARIEQRDTSLGLALLSLPSPLRHTTLARAIGDGGAELPLPPTATRDAFPGSPGYALFYPPTPRPDPDWPQLQAGFNGLAATAGRPGLSVPAQADGGPLLNARGELAGVMIRSCADQTATTVPISQLRQRFASIDWGAATISNGDATPAPGPLPTEQIYENGLRLALQVLVQGQGKEPPRCGSAGAGRSGTR